MTMLLAIDTGNTHTILGCINDRNEVIRTVQISTDINETAYEYAVEIKDIMELAGIDPKGFEGAIISSVVPQVNVVLAKAVNLITGLTPVIVGAGVKTGLNIRLDDPGTIAGDLVIRFLPLLWIWERQPRSPWWMRRGIISAGALCREPEFRWMH